MVNITRLGYYDEIIWEFLAIHYNGNGIDGFFHGSVEEMIFPTMG